MRKHVEKHICPKCKNKIAIKYGMRNGIQRYSCPRCGVVSDKPPKLSAKDKEFLTKLIKLVFIKQGDYHNIKEILNAVNETPLDIQTNDIFDFAFKNLKGNEPIMCSYPKMLLSYEHDKIVMYRFDNRYLVNNSNCSIQILHNAE